MNDAGSARRFANGPPPKAQADLERASAVGREATRRAQTAYCLLSQGAIDYQRKILEIAQGNLNAVFDYAHEMTSAGSIFEASDISARYARQHILTVTGHASQLAAGFQRLTGDVGRQFSGI